MFLSSPPEKESKFQKLKSEKGSFWAFHGSAFSNWHSILRIGLKNYSGTALMSTGAAFGNGIYLCKRFRTMNSCLQLLNRERLLDMQEQRVDGQRVISRSTRTPTIIFNVSVSAKVRDGYDLSRFFSD
jgi:hypothetical protein